ncbi:MAG: methyltransferase [Clostridia bacterium]|nr:methyltransferase [Clostridia bacterium]
MIHEKLRKHYLGNHTVVFTDSVHRFGTDAVLLADFSAPKKKDKAIEFGTGCGIVSLIWCRDEKPLRIDALELQEDAVDLVKMAIEENHLHDRFCVKQGDLKQVEMYYNKGYYDLAVMNPPYKKADDGVITPIKGLAIARHEMMCNLSEICQAASIVLNTGGRFCMCHRPSRLSEVLCAMHQAGLEPKRLRFVQQNMDAAPNLFLIEGKKGAGEGMVVEPSLLLEDAQGAPTAEVIQIYGAYYDQKERNR